MRYFLLFLLSVIIAAVIIIGSVYAQYAPHITPTPRPTCSASLTVQCR